MSITEHADALRRTGQASFGGVVKEVNLGYLPQARVGDYVIVHVGIALSVVQPEEAQRILADYREIQDLMRDAGT